MIATCDRHLGDVDSSPGDIEDQPCREDMMHVQFVETQRGPASPKLREVQIRIWENSRCKDVFRREVPITSANVCAGDGDKDACRGDSGGPLMLAHTDGKFYLVGIVSFGKKCANPGVPGVYCRISHFLDWIEQQVESTT
ncbi:proclotting enzyme [Trichonephila clavipes]|nr:proclotting enzyme [Trichonephila clavipes]